MPDVTDRRRIAHEVYTLTGVLVPEDDVLVLAAMFYAEKMREAARDAAGAITAAGDSSRVAADEAKEAVRQATANNKALADLLEARMQRALVQALKAQSTREGGIVLTVKHLFGSFALGAASVVLATCMASGFSYSWMADATVGKAYRAILPDLDPATKAKIMEQLKKSMDK